MEVTVNHGWTGELQDLQTETLRLLQTIRGADVTKGGAQNSHDPPAAKRGTRRRRPAKLQAMGKSKGLDDGVSKGLSSSPAPFRFSGNTLGMGKSTVEVLDMDEEAEQQKALDKTAEGGSYNSVEKLEMAEVVGAGRKGEMEGHSGASEERFRSLAFGEEEKRVRTAFDVFVPGPDTTLRALQVERERLFALEEAQREAGRKQGRSDFERHVRRKWAIEDNAARSIQCVFRGSIGRRRVALMREAFLLTRQTSAEWVEVRDRETGDVWYYNTASGSSQWERPSTMLGALSEEDRVKKLPALSPVLQSHRGPESDQQCVAQSPGQGSQQPADVAERASSKALPPLSQQQQQPATSSPPLDWGWASLRDAARPPDWVGSQNQGPGEREEEQEEEQQQQQQWEQQREQQEEREEGAEGAEEEEEGARLFLADGSPNVHLRQTIKSALKVSKFDSVSTLVADYSKRSAAAAAATRPSSSARGGVLSSLLESEKKPTLFGASGKHMVSVMCRGKKRARSKTAVAGRKKVVDKSSVTAKDIVLRDLTAPGFSPPEPSAAGAQDGAGEGGTEEKTPVVAAAATAAAVVAEICFNCWSAGSGKSCGLHRAEGAQGAGGSGSSSSSSSGVGRPSESALMCKNWDLGVMRRRYRAEELQEVFAQQACSLRYDKERKKFVAVVKQRHPVYRLLSNMRARYNFTMRRRLHQRNWGRAFVDQLRRGKLDDGKGTSRLLRLRNTLQNIGWVSHYVRDTRHLHPKAPITGTTLPERLGTAHFLVDRYSPVYKRTVKCIMDGPVPVPEALYDPREYFLPAPSSIPMPEPSYAMEPPAAAINRIMEQGHAASWVERFCGVVAGDVTALAQMQVAVRSPVKGADQISQTKYPPALTVRFATFSRKPCPRNVAVGGLAVELIASAVVTTYVPPQYGNITVMQKSSTAPTVSLEISVLYPSLQLDFVLQVYVPRPLRHQLNLRKGPTVMICNLIKPSERFFYGTNRPQQTGEELSHGFRTSSYAEAPPTSGSLDMRTFKPSADIATPNLCCANRTVTTHADRSYPFCEPSNRLNTTLDFYHLLLTSSCSPNKEQVFTNLGIQECGEFMRGSDPRQPMGHCVSVVYRSWAFLQRQAIEEFETDDGIPYWFDRRTGETFWERPLANEELIPVKEGGTVLSGVGEAPDSAAGAYEEIQPRYDQHQMRKLMKRKHETLEEVEERRRAVAQSVKWARENGQLPPPSDVDGLYPSREDDASGSAGVELDSQQHQQQQDSTVTSSSGSAAVSSQMGHPQASKAAGGDEPAVAVGVVERKDATSPATRRVGQREGAATSSVSPGDAAIITTITNALADKQLAPEDMIRIGMGLGITLKEQGLIGGSSTDGDAQHPDGAVAGAKAQGEGGERDATHGLHDEEAPRQHQGHGHKGHPIGHGHAHPNNIQRDVLELDHSEEERHRQEMLADSADRKDSAAFMGLTMVKPTLPPDEDPNFGKDPKDIETDPRSKADLQVPIVAYPETLWKKEYNTHAATGEGESWISSASTATGKTEVKSGQGLKLRRTFEPLPVGFLNAITHTHVGKQHVDYLPHVPNLPVSRAVGRVKPRSATEDWFAVGFDPWSAGREPLSVEFVSTLTIKEEDLIDQGSSVVPQTSYIESKDEKGHMEMAMVSAEEAKMATDFEMLTSWARHGRYGDVETAMNQPDWLMPIDYQNEHGLALLHVAAQNGNKRIIKLCLRKGADVNKQNHNGQTALHYAFGYGFDDLGQYLISKGADDGITNADGLTCYEGISSADIA